MPGPGATSGRPTGRRGAEATGAARSSTIPQRSTRQIYRKDGWEAARRFASDQLEHGDRPLRDVDMDLSIGLRPRQVVGVARAVPATEPGVLRTQDLLPPAVVARGDPVPVAG